MKKLVFVAVIALALLGTTPQVFAANNVSQMAVNRGGQTVAQCAQNMEKGVSECAKLSECHN
jgi:hypothetical protein